MPNVDQSPPERTAFEIRWNRRSFRRNILGIGLLFLAYVAIAVFTPGWWRLMSIVGAIVFGGVALTAGAGGVRQMQRSPVAATLNEFGVTIGRHDPAAWQIFREVRLGAVKPRLLFALRPLHYIAFVPEQSTDLPPPTPRERLAIRIYGTNLLLMTETVTPAADDILAAVQRLSDVPVRR